MGLSTPCEQMVSMEMGRERAELEMQQMKDQMSKLSDEAGASAQDPATQVSTPAYCKVELRYILMGELCVGTVTL